MGLKSKIITGLAIVGACGVLAGMTGAIATGILGEKSRTEAFVLLKADRTYRLTTEFNVEKSEFEVVTEKFVYGEISELEYKISKMKFDSAQEKYEDNLRKLELRDYLKELISSVPKDEECAKEYAKSQKLGSALGGCVAGGLISLVATIPIMVDGVVSHKAYRRGWIER